MDLRSVPVPAENLRMREVDDETVFLAEGGDEVLSLNAVGSFIWRQIDGRLTLRDIVDVVCDEYEVTPDIAENDLRAFVTELEAHELLSLRAPED
jgi:hypothetical protein